MRFKARLLVLLVAALVTQVTTFIISILVNAVGTNVPAIPFAIFACITLALTQRWILVDAAKAFGEAVAKRHVLLQGDPPQITFIVATCPKRWFVLLHIQLHPELLGQGSE
ncbi:hypothetical protein [Caballeronia sp. M23-90]|jgi:hypothetical protein